MSAENVAKERLQEKIDIFMKNLMKQVPTFVLDNKEIVKELKSLKVQYERKLADLEEKYPDLCYEDTQGREELQELKAVDEASKNKDSSKLTDYCRKHLDDLQEKQEKLNSAIADKKNELQKLKSKITEIAKVNNNLDKALSQHTSTPEKCLIDFIKKYELLDEKQRMDQFSFLEYAVKHVNGKIRVNKQLQQICQKVISQLSANNSTQYIPDPTNVSNPSKTFYNAIFQAYQMSKSNIQLKDQKLCAVFAQTLILYVKKQYNPIIKRDDRKRAEIDLDCYNNVLKDPVIKILCEKVKSYVYSDSESDSDEESGDKENKKKDQLQSLQKELMQEVSFLTAFAAVCGKRITYNKGSNPPCLELKEALGQK